MTEPDVNGDLLSDFVGHPMNFVWFESHGQITELRISGAPGLVLTVKARGDFVVLSAESAVGERPNNE